MRAIRSKGDVEFHSDGFGYDTALPAVNVKVDIPMDDELVKLAERVAHDDGDPDPQAFGRWVDAKIDAGDFDVNWELFNIACESEWEMLEMDLTEDDRLDRPIFDRPVTIEAQGRSGGWAVVRGLKDFEEWDAIDLMRWRRFARLARGYADDVPYAMLSILYLNEYESWRQSALNGPIETGVGL